MNVSLTPEQQRFVDSKLESGLYHTAAEVIREGLRLMMERERLEQQKLEALRDAIREGIEAVDRGEIHDGEAVFSKLRHKLNEKSE